VPQRPGNIGFVRALHLRPSRAQAPQAVDRALAIAGTGLDGDVHADPLSPRQVLLACADVYARHALPAHALRENLLVDIDTCGLRSGTLLQVGAQARLWLTFQCEACARLNARQPGLSSRIGGHRGMLARVVCGGTIKPGDSIVQLNGSLPALSDDWRHRVANVLARVPDGMVIEYKQLARVSGVQLSYCRVFPRIARELGLSHKAVSMHSPSTSRRWQGHQLFAVDGH
jgi:hypothetical protein